MSSSKTQLSVKVHEYHMTSTVYAM